MTRPVITTTRRGDITFHPSGRIDLTAHVSKSLGLHPGDVVNIAEECDSPSEHYLYVVRRSEETTGRHSCTCRKMKSASSANRSPPTSYISVTPTARYACAWEHPRC